MRARLTRRRLGAAALAAPLPARALTPAPEAVVERHQVRFGGLPTPIEVVLRVPTRPAPPGGFPVLYLFHGRGGSASDLFASLHLDRPFDRIPFLLAAPDLGAGWGVDGPSGSWERVLGLTLPRWVEERHPVRADRGGRAVAGISMGGFAALRLGLAQPHRYASVAALSPALWLDVASLERDTHDAAWLFDGVFGTPFDPVRYIDASPLGLAVDPGSAPSVFLACGTEDAFVLAPGTQALADRLLRQGARVTLDLGPGGHDEAYWSRKLAPLLAFVGASFG